MKRFITILILILIILGVLLGVSWFISRKTAQKNGTPPPTFREFLRFGAKTGQKGSADGDLTSVFSPTNSQNSSSTPQGEQNPPAEVLVSDFTDDSYTPPLDGGLNSGGVITGGGGITGGGTTGSGGGTPPTGGGGGAGNTGGGNTAPVPTCSDSDLSIEFTRAELDRLQYLQQKFYTLAETIHNDANVATELANYDAFKTKVNKIKELSIYCQQKAPLLTFQVYKQRVPTPFWHDLAKDTIAFISGWGGPREINGSVPLDDIPFGKYILEHVLRLNLW